MSMSGCYAVESSCPGDGDSATGSRCHRFGDRLWRRGQNADAWVDAGKLIDAPGQTADLAGAMEARQRLINGGTASQGREIIGKPPWPLRAFESQHGCIHAERMLTLPPVSVQVSECVAIGGEQTSRRKTCANGRSTVAKCCLKLRCESERHLHAALESQTMD